MAMNDQECDTALGLGVRGHFNGGLSISAQSDPLPPSSLHIFSSWKKNSSDRGSAMAEHGSEQYDDTHSLSPFHGDSKLVNHQTSYGTSIKKKNDGISDEEEEGGGGTRKKLRLLKDQTALLEESFRLNNTLNPKQKQALAKQLNLRPRQVEVWFQNRRARSKLKQTEVDCEFLKGCYESLTEENRRLQKELAELRSLKLSAASP
ncbi:hypothetical protein KI387_009135, partial [Taxus chinensis]